jgi:pimeloyl-ACP methyl ester carboxylesterase
LNLKTKLFKFNPNAIFKFCFYTLVILLSSCANPTVAVNSEIKRFKLEHKDQILKFNGKNGVIGYAWSGDPTKRPIVFVHGSPGSWEGWSHFLLDPELQKNYHLISIDRPGFGESRPGIPVTSIAAQASDVIEILKLNKSQKAAILVGHSFGGPVIAKAAMDSPDLIAGLVFVASSVDPDLETIKWFQYPATWWPIRLLIPSELRVCNEEILPLKSELIAMLPFWKNIKARSALIQGELDQLVPPGNQDFLIKQLDQKTIVKVMRIPELNHFVPWKRPNLIVEGIQIVNSSLTY